MIGIPLFQHRHGSRRGNQSGNKDHCHAAQGLRSHIRCQAGAKYDAGHTVFHHEPVQAVHLFLRKRALPPCQHTQQHRHENRYDDLSHSNQLLHFFYPLSAASSASISFRSFLSCLEDKSSFSYISGLRLRVRRRDCFLRHWRTFS